MDRPFRDPDRLEWEGITLADKLMIVSQVAQLVNYYVAALCLRSKESRLADGEFGTSEEVELLAAVVGFALVVVQAAGVIYAYRSERAKDTGTGVERAPGEAGKKDMDFANPMAVDSPE